jgi:phosphoribosylaminoimidazolecarboxamide formyltransferase/IMP cyclohydrolase
MIDIGGPTMVRAAAKNHEHVGIVVDPADYGPVLDEIRLDGKLSETTRKRLARVAFAHTAAYDAAIVDWLDGGAVLPPTIHLALERVQELRYGENPHQEAARYRSIGGSSFWDSIQVEGAMALSYLNLYDAEAAWRLAYDLGDGPVAVIVKHANPCGVGVAATLDRAYQLAFECDERSAFGGIVAVNQTLDAATVEAMVNAAQADVVIAPAYEPGAIEALAKKRRNTRVITATPPVAPARDYRQIDGGFLVQDAHHFERGRDSWRVVTERAPTEDQWADAELAWRICGHVKSNSIVLVKDGQAVGIGAGQQNRVEAGLIAASKAGGRAQGGACASDAFYPFPDGIEAAADAGAAVVIQPGGGLHDDEIIAAADKLGLAMVFTGERHFLH